MCNLTKYIFIFLLVLLYPLQSKLNWEHQIENMNFINLNFNYTNKIISGNGQYFLFYWGADPSKINTINGIKYGVYPALMSFNKEGNLLFRREEPIPLYDTLKANGYISTNVLTEFFSSEDGINLVIPEGVDGTYNPNYFRYSSIDGSLKSIDGYENGQYQLSTLTTIINNNNLFVLSSFSPNFINESSINVHSLEVENTQLLKTLKYRILLDHTPFKDILLSDDNAFNFIFCNDSTFFVFYLANDYKTQVIAKYSYNRDSANTLPKNSNIYANLINYTVYIAKSNEGIVKTYKLENGNYLAMHYRGGFVTFNENTEIIKDELPFANSSYDNFYLNSVLPLKKKPGYYALYGAYKDNGNYNFAIVIADSLWNKVDEYVWDYGGNYNLLEDMVESDDGNFIVYGYTRYKINNQVVLKSYYASVHFDILMGVDDNNKANNDIFIQPNPATNYITLQGEAMALNNVPFIEIYDVMGIKVQTIPYNLTATDSYNLTPRGSDNLTPTLSKGEGVRIDVSNLSPGVYFVKIGGKVQKFVKI